MKLIATPITRPEQVQAPHSNHYDPDNTKGKIARNNSTGDTDYISSDRSHLCEPSNFSTNDSDHGSSNCNNHPCNHKFMHGS